MPQLATRYFGPLEFDPDAVLDFPSGIPGFERETRFLLIESDRTRPLAFMQSLATPELCFLVLPARSVQPDYRLNLTPEYLAELEFPADCRPGIGVDVACLVLITVGQSASPTANLLAPVVVNLLNRRAVQAIQTESGYSHQRPIPEAATEALC